MRRAKWRLIDGRWHCDDPYVGGRVKVSRGSCVLRSRARRWDLERNVELVYRIVEAMNRDARCRNASTTGVLLSAVLHRRRDPRRFATNARPRGTLAASASTLDDSDVANTRSIGHASSPQTSWVHHGITGRRHRRSLDAQSQLSVAHSVTVGSQANVAARSDA